MRVRILIALVLLTTPALAQFTVVTGTVIDPNTLPYSGGSIAAVLVTPGGQSVRLNGLAYSPPAQPSGLDATGHFVMRLADNTVLTPAGTTWQFFTCSQVGATVQPAFGKGSVCFTLAAPITISGSAQDISTQLQAAALPLTVPFGGGTGLTCTPVTNYALLLYNSTGTCAPSQAAVFGLYQPPSSPGAANILTVGGGSSRTTPGGFQALGATSGNFGAFFYTNGPGTQFIWGANANGFPITTSVDAALNPINYIKFLGNTSAGWEFSGNGDVTGSGSAAGFVINNAASGLATSPGAPVSFTAGNAAGNDTTSHGGDISETAGNNTTGTSNARGGDVTITAGNGQGTGRGGNLNLTSGTGGVAGQILCNGSPCQGTLSFDGTCEIATAITLSTSATTLCTWTLPTGAKTWGWQCSGTYTLTGGVSPLFGIGINAAQAPTTETGNGNIWTTSTGTSTQGSATGTSAGNLTVLSGATTSGGPFAWTMSGVIQASATPGTFVVFGFLGGSAPSGTVNGGSTCLLYSANIP